MDVELIDLIPQPLREEAVSLEPIGCHEWAWPRLPAVAVIDWCVVHGLAVLGGDVLRVADGQPEYTYGNWYIADRSPAESWAQFVDRAGQVARHAIGDYPETDGDPIVYALTVTDEVEYPLLREP